MVGVGLVGLGLVWFWLCFGFGSGEFGSLVWFDWLETFHFPQHLASAGGWCASFTLASMVKVPWCRLGAKMSSLQQKPQEEEHHFLCKMNAIKNSLWWKHVET